MSFFDLVVGKPLVTSEERAEHIGPIAGIPVFGLDALSSAAYGPEAALTLLIPLGLLGIQHIVPISLAIIGLLAIVYVSYLQTIDAYPHGGGSYTVASENLGANAGLFAAAALMIDYILNAAVGISAGWSAGVRLSGAPPPHAGAVPRDPADSDVDQRTWSQGHGDRISCSPTYLFVGTLLLVILVGAVRAFAAGGHPVPIVEPPHLPVSASMLLSVASGKGLRQWMHGHDRRRGRFSNGVNAFREPTQKNAKRTLSIIIALLMVFLAGIALLCRAYSIGATDPGAAGYQSILSQLTAAVMGRGWFYYVTIGSILAVLALSANTSYADFPRADARYCDARLSASRLHDPRQAFALFARGVCTCCSTLCRGLFFGGVTDPPDPAVCHRGLSCFHSVPGGHGHALEATGRPRLTPTHGD